MTQPKPLNVGVGFFEELGQKIYDKFIIPYDDPFTGLSVFVETHKGVVTYDPHNADGINGKLDVYPLTNYLRFKVTLPVNVSQPRNTFSLAVHLAHFLLHIKPVDAVEVTCGDHDTRALMDLESVALATYTLIPKSIYDQYIQNATAPERNKFALASACNVPISVVDFRVGVQNSYENDSTIER